MSGRKDESRDNKKELCACFPHGLIRAAREDLFKACAPGSIIDLSPNYGLNAMVAIMLGIPITLVYMNDIHHSFLTKAIEYQLICEFADEASPLFRENFVADIEPFIAQTEDPQVRAGAEAFLKDTITMSEHFPRGYEDSKAKRQAGLESFRKRSEWRGANLKRGLAEALGAPDKKQRQDEAAEAPAMVSKSAAGSKDLDAEAALVDENDEMFADLDGAFAEIPEGSVH